MSDGLNVSDQIETIAPLCKMKPSATCTIAAISLFIFFCSSVSAQETRAVTSTESASNRSTPADATNATVDTYIAEQLAAERIPGLALGVVRDGKLIKAQGFGLANIELFVPVSPETVFQTGSVGKQFTAAAVMMLVQEGKIGLDDKISKYLAGTPEKWKDVTVRNLLTHTSGIADYANDENLKHSGPINLRQDYTEDELFQKFTTLPMDFKPGKKWSYSNTGYVLLGILIHKVTGEFYGDFLHERLFRPLGMNSTRIISEADTIPNRSAGYELVNGVIKNQQWVSPTLNTTADGALYTNVLDIAKWDAALYTEQLLKKSSLEQMWTPVTLTDREQHPYGFGWDLAEVNGHRMIEHGGAWQGFTAHISRYLDDRLTVIVLTNLDADHSRADVIAHTVAAKYLPDVGASALKPIEDKEPQVTALVRTTLADLATGHVNVDSFPLNQREHWVAERIRGLSKVLQQAGSLKSIELLERKSDGTMNLYKYLAVFAERNMIINLILDSNGGISGLQIRSQ